MKKSFLKTKNHKPAIGEARLGRLKTKKGFTILETMVAVFILTLSITGPMVFAQQGLRAAFLARDQITAFYLGQDIIETMKNIRDENALNNVNWMAGLYDSISTCSSPNPCPIYIDTTEPNPTAKECVGGVCPMMRLDSNGRFGYETDPSSTESRFKRTTYIEEFSANKEAKIVVEVEWASNVRVGNARILVQENIYNWIPVAQ